MAKPVCRYISELLALYHQYTDKTYSEMALDFDVTISNLYQYRKEEGNPTAETIDKIINGVELNCPKSLKEVSWW